jgi:hypothetical protein
MFHRTKQGFWCVTEEGTHHYCLILSRQLNRNQPNFTYFLLIGSKVMYLLLYFMVTLILWFCRVKQCIRRDRVHICNTQPFLRCTYMCNIVQYFKLLVKKKGRRNISFNDNSHLSLCFNNVDKKRNRGVLP